jgi:hypothetical protein
MFPYCSRGLDSVLPRLLARNPPCKLLRIAAQPYGIRSPDLALSFVIGGGPRWSDCRRPCVEILTDKERLTMPRWSKGRSGNPKGRPKRGQAFSDALRAHGTPDELAQLAWKAAREGAPWAIQMIFNRLSRSRLN